MKAGRTRKQKGRLCVLENWRCERESESEEIWLCETKYKRQSERKQ